MLAVTVRSAGGIVELRHYLRWHDANVRHPDVLASWRREGARVRSERTSAGAARSRKPIDQTGDRLSRSWDG